MKRVFTIFIFVVIVSGASNAQEYIYNRGLATLCIGTGLPSYAYGNQSGISLSSYAKLGTTITGEVAYFYSWHMGLNFMFSYSINPIDDNKLEEGYKNASPAFTSVSAKTEAFRDFSGFGGFIFDVPTANYLSMVF